MNHPNQLSPSHLGHLFNPTRQAWSAWKVLATWKLASFKGRTLPATCQELVAFDKAPHSEKKNIPKHSMDGIYIYTVYD